MAKRLEQMKAMSINVNNLHIQRMHVYLNELLIQPQTEELEALRIQIGLTIPEYGVIAGNPPYT